MRHPAYAGTTRSSGGRPVWTGVLNEVALDIPLRWRKPRKVFVNSMSDLFQDGVPDGFVSRVWETMARAHWHVYQILTKRPENMVRIVVQNRLAALPNVWLGTSVENSACKSRIANLREVPAKHSLRVV